MLLAGVVVTLGQSPAAGQAAGWESAGGAGWAAERESDGRRRWGASVRVMVAPASRSVSWSIVRDQITGIW